MAQAVVLDTDVFSALRTRSQADAIRLNYPVGEWRALLAGARIVISFQTRAEALSGALGAGWGAGRREVLRSILDETPTISPDVEVADAWAALTADARRAGHGIAQKEHAADRWVAACAIAKGIPLLSRDRIFIGAPGVTLLAG